ncbi:MAG TPA: alpha-L-arabinofuranosidase C-terminal domain-containing protein [Tepidisphaeraceae bacterium]|jgi:alpha-L-arabinofuranosidase
MVAPRDIVDGAQFSNNPITLSNSSAGELTISLAHPGAAISPTLFGLALEEINHSLDGGLYAELLRNRDLSQYGRMLLNNQVTLVPAFWSLIKSDNTEAEMTVGPAERPADTAARASIRLDITAIALGQRAGITNSGYWGIPVKPNWLYHASFYAKAAANFAGPLVITIESNDATTTYARATIDKITTSWQRYTVDLKTDQNVSSSLTNRFVISASSKGTLWITEASLFPPTFNNRPNGNRIDLMEKLADLKPGFIVFPGGDSLLAMVIRNRFDWKKTIGPVEKRSAQNSTWHYTSNGFGLMEFLLTCEDLHAQPILAIYDGTSIRQSVPPGPTLQTYIQDALDEIEYVTGDKSTVWGARRAADGHPDPFNLQFVQIGNNEQLYNKGTYDARFTQFHDAIKAKYPSLGLIGWMNLATARIPDVIHESFYSTARELMSDSNHYNAYPRSGPRFATEFNAKEGDPTKTLNAALADMSWMLNVQQNADAVVMATAAPLFVNINGGAAQHPANLIGYDSLNSFGSTSYYALRIFNENKGDAIIPVKLTPPEIIASRQLNFHGAIGVGSWGSDVEYKDIKVTAPDGAVLFQSDFSKSADGWHFGAGTWKADQGALHQTSGVIDCTAIAGDPRWGDYTLTLKARKNAGVEGFLILVHAADAGNFVWWNLGGWENTRTGMEQTLDGGKEFLGDLIPNRIETGRWYDIRIEVKGNDIVGYLDNAPVMTATERPHPPPPLSMFAAASRDNKTGELIIKVVNAMPQPSLLNITLDSASTIQNTGSLEVMSGNPGDMNSITDPNLIIPNRMTIHFPGIYFSHEFPPYSFSVLRLNAK